MIKKIRKKEWRLIFSGVLWNPIPKVFAYDLTLHFTFLCFSHYIRKQFLVCPMKHAAVLMTLGGDHNVVPLDDDVSHSLFFLNLFQIFIASHNCIFFFKILTSYYSAKEQ